MEAATWVLICLLLASRAHASNDVCDAGQAVHAWSCTMGRPTNKSAAPVRLHFPKASRRS